MIYAFCGYAADVIHTQFATGSAKKPCSEEQGFPKGTQLAVPEKIIVFAWRTRFFRPLRNKRLAASATGSA